MAQTIFWIIIAVILFDFVFENILDYLNYRNMKEKIPQELNGIYDKERYRKSQQYEKVNSGFSLITGIFNLAVILLMLFGGGFGKMDEWVRGITINPYLQTLLFFGVLALAYDLIMLPFQIYSTFVIEERFGFNKTTPLTFVTDKLKSWLLGAIIGGGIILFMQWAWMAAGQWFWLVAMAGITGFMIFMAMFYTDLIVPLFNKLTPLEEGELKTAIYDFASRAGFKLKNVFVINGSKRSTKANAYFSGLGPKKKIVLYDTLLHDLDNQEIVAVLAHETGHYKKKHVTKGLIMSLFQTALMVWLLGMALRFPELSKALGSNVPSFYMGIVAFGLLFTPVSFLTGIVSHIISRKHEYQADAFARSYHLGKQLINALIKLSRNNLSNLTPHPLYVFFHYSHPTLLQRKKAIEQVVNN